MRQIEILPGLWINNDRCAFLSCSRTMVLSDLHLGIEASLESSGLQIPRAQHEDVKMRISAAAETDRPKRIVVLGDVKHEFSHNREQERREVRDVLEHMLSLAEVTIVRGNHDNFLANITSRLEVELLDELELDGMHMVHGHIPSGSRPLLQGHEHPSVRLFDGVSGYVKLPSFLHYKKERILVLPAFSPLAAGNDINRMTSSDMLSPGLSGLDLDSAEVYGCSDIGLMRLGTKANARW